MTMVSNKFLSNLLPSVIKVQSDELYLRKLIELLNNVPKPCSRYKKLYIDNNYDEFYRSLGLEIIDVNPDQNEKAIIGVLNYKIFFQNVYKQILAQNNFPYSIKSVFWIAISKLEFQKFIARPENGFTQYTSNSVLFQSFFKWNVLIDTTACLKPKLKQSKTESVSLVKISVKVDPFWNIEENRAFFYFVKHLMFRRTDAIIPKLERWFPGIGVKLITKNLIKKRLNIWTRIGDLTPDEIYIIFKFIYHCPDYNACSFEEIVQF